MRRKRAWEIGATAALLLVVGLAAANAYSWHLRQQNLNAALAAELGHTPTVSTRGIRRLLHQGADIRTLGPSGETALSKSPIGREFPWPVREGSETVRLLKDAVTRKRTATLN